MISAGEWITASGVWLNDHNHGPCIQSAFLEDIAPSTLEGNRKIPRLGHESAASAWSYAKRLVRVSQGRPFDLIEAHARSAVARGGRYRAGAGRQDPRPGMGGYRKVIREINVGSATNTVWHGARCADFKTYGTDFHVQIMKRRTLPASPRHSAAIGFARPT